MPAYKNICDCQNPPGGRAVCEAHQLAICEVKDGKAETACISPPNEFSHLTSSSIFRLATADEKAVIRRDVLSFANWALSQITGAFRETDRSLSFRDFALFEGRLYRDRERSRTVSFKLPEHVAELFSMLQQQTSKEEVYSDT